MKGKWIAALLLAVPLVSLAAGEGDALKLRLIPSPNLVRNADFRELNEKGLPKEWHFDNCSRSPYFKSEVIQKEDGNCLAVNTEWKKFGYWLQDIPVQEGITYRAGVEVQSDDPTPGLWLMLQRKPDAAAWKGRTEFLSFRSTIMGDEMREALRDFVDEDLLVCMSATRWLLLDTAVPVPAGSGISACAMRVGIYGGNAGQARFRNPFFRAEQPTLEAEITGSGWTQLHVAGAVPETVKLDPAKAQQVVTVLLPKGKSIYKAELSDRECVRETKEICHE